MILNSSPKKVIKRTNPLDSRDITIKPFGDRKVLAEGRTHGMGFSLAVLKGDVLEELNIMSTCKDYLNDVIFNQITNKPINVFGASLTARKDPTNLLKTGPRIYMLVSYLKNKPDVEYAEYASDIKYLNSPLFQVNLRRLFGLFSVILCMPSLVIVSSLKNYPNIKVVEISSEWSNSTYLISLASLLMRISGYLKPDQDLIEFLHSLATDKGHAEYSHVHGVYNKFFCQLMYYKNYANNRGMDNIMGLELNKYFLNDFPTDEKQIVTHSIHNAGILSHKFT